ncbi:CUB and sushi domain-containing protein 1-like isoform X4 [Clavelina lepadiformis]|uniref:CUB and sushi domain-containing protein 1-like isoform X4 n=1 Tax=Clavelina lepadiformis TaxID=159417 RepID=UPI004041D421
MILPARRIIRCLGAILLLASMAKSDETDSSTPFCYQRTRIVDSNGIALIKEKERPCFPGWSCYMGTADLESTSGENVGQLLYDGCISPLVCQSSDCDVILGERGQGFNNGMRAVNCSITCCQGDFCNIDDEEDEDEEDEVEEDEDEEDEDKEDEDEEDEDKEDEDEEDDNEEDEDEEITSTQVLPVDIITNVSDSSSPEGGSTCYQILQVSTAEGVHITDDRSETNCFMQANCLLVEATSIVRIPGLPETTWKMKYGGCIPAEQCDQFDCKTVLGGQLDNIIQGVEIQNCTTSCCQGDLCNSDQGGSKEEEEEDDDDDEQDDDIENEYYVMVPENVENETDANQKVPETQAITFSTAESPEAVTPAGVPSSSPESVIPRGGSTCQQILHVSSGQGISLVDVRNETDCYLKSSCLLVKATMKVNLPGSGLQEVPWTMTYGGCAAFGQCNQLDCKGLLSQALQSVPYDTEIVDCKASCCEGDLCNGDESILEDGGSSTIVTSTSSTGIYPSLGTVDDIFTDVEEATTGFPASCGFNDTITEKDLSGFAPGEKPGIIRSPNYPGFYFPNHECFWSVTVPESYVVSLSVVKLELEECCDYLTMNTDIEGIVQINSVGNYASKSNSVLLQFTSDETIHDTGFIIRYGAEEIIDETMIVKVPAHESGDLCGNNITITPGQAANISTPNYPGHYYNNAYCEWTLHAPQDKLIRLQIIDFNLESCCDQVALMDPSTEEVLLETGGNDVLPGAVWFSASNKLLIRFKSDSSVTDTGFLLAYSAVDPSEQIETITATVSTTTSISNTEPALSCGFFANVTDVPQYFTSPYYPNNYPNNIRCEWAFYAPVGYRIRVHFMDIQTESCCDNIEVSEEESAIIIIDPSSLSDNTFISKSDILFVWFDTNGDTNFRGFNASFSIEETTQLPTTTTTATLTTQNTTTDPSEIPASTPTTATERTTISARLGECGFNANATSTSQDLYSPGFPEQYRSNLDCVWVLTSRPGYYVNFTISSFETESCCDYLNIYDGDQLLEKLQGIKEPTSFIGRSGSIQLTFRSDGSVTADGFQASFIETDQAPLTTRSEITNTRPETTSTSLQTTTTTCGFEAEATNVSQPIHSPGWPGYYPSNADCEWVLTARPGYQVQLELRSLSTEPCCDRLDITNNGDVQVLKGRDGTYPRRVLSTNRRLELRFYSDGSVQDPGFDATFIEVQVNLLTASPCGFETRATNVSQPLNSPGWPDNYDDSLECTWELTASYGKWIRLEFLNFDTESCCDRLTVSSRGTELGRYTGSSLPPVTTARNSLRLVFRSDGSVNRPGFQAVFQETDNGREGTAPCGFTDSATENPQSLNSPGFPSAYSSNLDCEWNLSAANGRRIVIEFTSFFTEECCDYLSALDENDIEIKRIRGENLTVAPILSTTSRLKLRFHSDGSVVKSGFTGTFRAVSSNFSVITPAPIITTEVPVAASTVVDKLLMLVGTAPCGFEARASNLTQPLNSPGWPHSYDDSLDCTWELNASDGKWIRVEFRSFDTETCCDSLTASSNGTNVGTYRGASVPRAIVVSSSLRLVFRSDGSVTRSGFQAVFFAVPSNFAEITTTSTTTEATTLTNTAAETRITGAPAPVSRASGGCGFDAVTTDVSQVISSPNYPNNYPHFAYCRWNLRAPTNDSRIRIEITNLDTESCCDYVEILEDGVRVSREAGTQINTPIYVSTSSRVLIRFLSDSSIRSRGFQLTYETAAPNMTSVSRTTQATAVLTRQATAVISDKAPTATEATNVTTTAAENRITGAPAPVSGAFGGCGFDAVTTNVSQVISSPNYPNNYPHFAYCRWNLRAPTNDSRIRIEITNLDTESCCDYVEILEDGVRVSIEAGTQINTPIYVSTSSRVLIRFLSDPSIRSRGFQLTYETAAPNMTSVSRTTQATTVLTRQATAVISEKAPNATEATTLTTTATENRITETTASVSGASGSCGFSAVASIIPRIFTSPGWPNGYDNYNECTWNISAPAGNHILFNFTTFQTESCCDYLEFTEDLYALTSHRLKGSLGTNFYETSSNGVLVHFRSDGSLTFRGFRGYFVAVSPSEVRIPSNQTTVAPARATTEEIFDGLNCATTLFAAQDPQYAESPGYPVGYEINTDCSWTIYTPQSDQRILISFVDLDLACCNDIVQIFDGNQPVGMPLNAQYLASRDQSAHESYVSHSDNVRIRLRTFGPRTSTGFRLQFQLANITQVTLPCGSDTYLAQPVMMQSPNYPDNYPDGQRCQWTLDAPFGMRVVLNISYLRLESCCDYLELFDGSDSRPIAKLGQRNIIESKLFRSSTNLMTVLFYSDNSVNYRGFLAAAYPENMQELDSDACGFTYVATSKEVRFSTPNYPNEYPGDSSCVWLLTSPYPGGQVELEIDDFRTEACCDHLTIYDGKNSSAAEITTIEGQEDDHERSFVSTSGSLYLKFTSDTSQNYRGFSAVFKLVERISNRTTPLPWPTVVATSISNTTAGEKRCFTGLKFSAGFGIQQNSQILSPCPVGSSCVDVRGRASSILSATSVSLAYGMCVPNIACVSLTCEEIQRQIPSSAAGNLDDCSVRCCEEDLCNDPDVDPVSPSSSPETLTVSTSATSSNSSASGDKRCYNGVSVTALGVNQNLQNVTDCPSGSSCVDMRGAVSNPFVASSVKMAVGLCLPTIACPTLTCEEIQRQIPSSAGVDLDDCSVRCCEEDLCNDPDVDPVSPSSSPETLTVSTSATSSNSSASGDKRCYNGVSVTALGVSQNLQNVTDCPSGSSCVDMRGAVSNPFVASSVKMAVGLCLPTIACPTLTCEEIQRQIPSSAAVSLDDCSVRCCEEDLCNDPDVDPMLVASITTPVSDDTRSNASKSDCDDSDDVALLPGCSYKEMYNQLWLCSTLFFNSYPYSDLTECSTNLQLQDSCSAGVITKCLRGNKPTIVSSLPAVDDIFLEQMRANFGNISQFIPMSFELLCEKDVNVLSQLTGGISGAMLDLQQLDSPICDSERLQSSYSKYVDQLRRFVHADDSIEFCSLYDELFRTGLQLFEVCDFAELLSSTLGSNNLLANNFRKIITLIPDLIKHSFIPKCLALETIEELRPSRPSIAVPINKTSPDENGCSSYFMDLMFLIDGSGSIRLGEFPQVLEFVKQVAASLDLFYNRVGVMQYSHYYNNRPPSQQPFMETEIELGHCKNRICFERAVDQIQHHGYTTFTAHAIQKAVEIDLANSDRFNDSCTRKVIVVITDGRSTDYESLQRVCDEAREKGVILIPVGVRGFVAQELEVIGGNERIHTANDFFDLVSIVPVVRDELANLLSDGSVLLASAP